MLGPGTPISRPSLRVQAQVPVEPVRPRCQRHNEARIIGVNYWADTWLTGRLMGLKEAEMKKGRCESERGRERKKIDVVKWTDGGGGSVGGGEAGRCRAKYRWKWRWIKLPLARSLLYFLPFFFHKVSKCIPGYPSESKSHLHNPPSDSMCLSDSWAHRFCLSWRRKKRKISEAGRTETEYSQNFKYFIDNELVSGKRAKQNKTPKSWYLQIFVSNFTAEKQSHLKVRVNARETEVLPDTLCDGANCCDVVLMSECVCKRLFSCLAL